MCMKPIYWIIVPGLTLLGVGLLCVSFMEFQATGVGSGFRALCVSSLFLGAAFKNFKKGQVSQEEPSIEKKTHVR